ncbi:uncharacterized protein LOC131858301 [Cryptomeria japonica]|uniref:uncharacterized protein LOC131858301 n=1 Tax=Cryptomeria japonica TaxID=3369 RepID=UPI0027DA1422|nr:uncharacterized protein LOC131858301 [Cryptomeria japonica]
MGINGPSRYILCQEQEETVDHLLLHYKFSSHYWWHFTRKLRIFGPFPSRLDEWFLQWPKSKGKAIFVDLLYILPSLLIWEIWKERNHRIFQGKEMSLTSLCGKIENHLIELLNEVAQSKSLNKNVYMDWDWKIKLALPNLLIPPLFCKGPLMDQVNPRLGVKWEVPEPGWFKVNFDGASAGNPGQSGIGCILRNSNGICIKEISKKIGVATNNEAKFRVALRGLQLGMELGVQRVHLEGDSLNVVNVVHCNNTPSWLLN